MAILPKLTNILFVDFWFLRKSTRKELHYTWYMP